MPDHARPSTNIFRPFETAVFEHEGRQYQATLDDEGRLQVVVSGRRNGRMLLMPEANNCVTIFSERAGPRAQPREG